MTFALSGIEVAHERFIHSDLLSSYIHNIYYNYFIFINNKKGFLFFTMGVSLFFYLKKLNKRNPFK